MAYKGRVRALLRYLVRALPSRGQSGEHFDTGNLCHFEERLKAVVDKLKEGFWVERPQFVIVTTPLK